MTKTVAFLKLIRFPNLLMIALTQYILRWCVILPVFDLQGIQPILTELDFFFVVLSTVLIAAAGYTINDYFDLKIDRINKPDKVIVGKLIKRRVAMALHIVLNGLAFLLAAYMSYKIGWLRLVGIHVICAGLLWYYSISFKKHVLVGNIVIAILAAAVPLTSFIYEFMPLRLIIEPKLAELLWEITIWYAGFAFITSVIREIIKDLQDLEGDQRAGCKTLPIVTGIKFSKVIALLLCLTTMSLLAYIQYRLTMIELHTASLYIALALQIPIFILIVLVVKAKDKKVFGKASLWTKIIMLSGILSLPVMYFLYSHFYLSV